MRSNLWLEDKLEQFLKTNFSDLEIPNNLTIGFGRKARRRLGSIKMTRDKKTSHITINGIFRDAEMPERIIEAVIAHELCHYAHGFSSPIAKLYDHPHRGNVIGRELRKRGLHFLDEYEKVWTKSKWPKIIEKEFPRQAKRSVSIRYRRSPGLIFIKKLADLIQA